MKKLLITSTALVMFAGAAAAEVKLSGDARMGVLYNGEEWNFSSRARVAFTLSGTTDTGLEFGAKFQADDADSDSLKKVDGTTVSGAENGTSGSVFLSGAFGKIEMGDTVSASEALFGDLPEIGYTDLNTNGSKNAKITSLNNQDFGSNEIPYLTGDDGTQSALLYTYSAGAFSVAASMTDGQKNGVFDNVATPAVNESEEAQAYAAAAAYTFGNYTVGVGYEKIDAVLAKDDQAQTEIAGTAKFGNTDVKAYYATGDDANPVDKSYGIGVASVFGATTVSGYVQKTEFTSKTLAGMGGDDSVTWYGLGAAYDLGGGAAVVGGIADNNLEGSDVVADLGVKFKF